MENCYNYCPQLCNILIKQEIVFVFVIEKGGFEFLCFRLIVWIWINFFVSFQMYGILPSHYYTNYSVLYSNLVSFKLDLICFIVLYLLEFDLKKLFKIELNSIKFNYLIYIRSLKHYMSSNSKLKFLYIYLHM